MFHAADMIGRNIRPRPLSYTERIRVVFLHRPKDPESTDSPPLDPALEEFLKKCQDERDRGQNGLLSGLETSRRRRVRLSGRACLLLWTHQPCIGIRPFASATVAIGMGNACCVNLPAYSYGALLRVMLPSKP